MVVAFANHVTMDLKAPTPDEREMGFKNGELTINDPDKKSPPPSYDEEIPNQAIDFVILVLRASWHKPVTSEESVFILHTKYPSWCPLCDT
ncbi:hypothetical protein GWI33_014102 [Rhynchophorus ferrugineus]|uniref:Uncharacterized protein n=1 Tax=Rhynchophorus ferrugineus TaxID=354439 RepID=A0A834M9E7_RHYFE|nr:hypothetical protein GWI33_014102 [Rhynchophorus ferrugineus]